MGVDNIVAAARKEVQRLTPVQAWTASQAGALLVDTRSAEQRERGGCLPSALAIERNVLEWRMDPASSYRVPELTGYELEVVVICEQGYSSSLAAQSLRRLGLTHATDVVGGVEAWIAAGLPTSPGPPDDRSDPPQTRPA
jgi:rhodanese-related sulfurtransferase